MIAAGLAILVVGLVLLTGGRTPRTPTPRTPQPPSPPTAAPDPAPPTPEPEPAPPAPVPCDWSAWLDLDEGGRQLLRAPQHRSCCRYVLRITSTPPPAADDPDRAPTDEIDEVDDFLTWSGAATRITPRGATTPLQRDRVTRRLATSATVLDAFLMLDRAPGTEVTTPNDATADPADLFRHHLDDLRSHGARPAPTEGPAVPPLVSEPRRLEVTLEVERGCATPAHRTVVRGECRARLEGHLAAPGTGRLDAPMLASWIEVGDTVVAATEPTTLDGVTHWQPVTDGASPGVAVACDSQAPSTTAEWSGGLDTEVAPHTLTLVLGHAVRLELDTDEPAGGEVRADLRATTSARATLTIEAPPVAGDTACRCVPDLQLALGAPGAPAVRPAAPGSTSGVELRLDGRTFRLSAPAAGSRSWTLAAADGTVQAADATDTIDATGVTG
jgi:hypothetical protein